MYENSELSLPDYSKTKKNDHITQEIETRILPINYSY